MPVFMFIRIHVWQPVGLPHPLCSALLHLHCAFTQSRARGMIALASVFVLSHGDDGASGGHFPSFVCCCDPTTDQSVIMTSTRTRRTRRPRDGVHLTACLLSGWDIWCSDATLCEITEQLMDSRRRGICVSATFSPLHSNCLAVCSPLEDLTVQLATARAELRLGTLSICPLF